MKAKECITAILFLVLVTCAAIANANERFTRKFHEEFQTDLNTTVDIKNKYGHVKINNWDNNSVKIDVIITVEADDKEDADEVFNQIRIELKKEDNIVKAHTIINKLRFKGELEINYHVSMPKYLTLYLQNKYGSTFINELTGYVNLDIKYGSLKINNLTRGKEKPKNQINMAYSDAIITKCKWLKLGVKYSKAVVDQSIALIIVSKYSKLYVGKSSSIVAESKYDTPYEIEEVNNFVCNGKYGKYEIEKVNSLLNLNMGYSDIEIGEIGADFESIQLDLKYSNVEGDLPDAVEFHIFGDMKYGDIELPKMQLFNKKRDGTEISISGSTSDNAKASITINGKYSNVEF